MSKPEFVVQLPPLQVPAFQLIMEGLSLLPLHRSKGVYDALDAEAKAQLAAYNAPPMPPEAPPLKARKPSKAKNPATQEQPPEMKDASHTDTKPNASAFASAFPLTAILASDH